MKKVNKKYDENGSNLSHDTTWNRFKRFKPFHEGLQ